MSSGYWQTKRQTEQYSTGNTITQRVLDYVKTWEGRCYFEGIPDDLPKGVMRSNRVPSYKAIAIAILSNDHNLYGLGFSERQSKTVDLLIQLQKNNDRVSVMQCDMFAASTVQPRLNDRSWA